MINEDGSNLVRITENIVFDSFPMFSADEEKLALVSTANQTNHTLLMLILQTGKSNVF